MTVSDRILSIKKTIEEARLKSPNKDDVIIVGVTKNQPVEAANDIISNGISIIAENRVQAMKEKIDSSLLLPSKRHLIGHLQTNKVKLSLDLFDLIQSVDSEKLAGVIAKYAQKNKISQDILLEVNIAKEASKGGIYPEVLPQIIENLCNIDGLRIRGLMAIPPISHFTGENLYHFDKMRQLFIDISQKKYDNVSMDFLSMGMSGDFEDAISCGSNMVRVGTAIFGARPYMIK